DAQRRQRARHLLVGQIKKPYAKLLNWALGHSRSVIAAAVGLLIVAGGLFGQLGTSFIPEMKGRFDCAQHHARTEHQLG
ncbi:MAG: hypothetical protein ACP5Q0_04005, partial [Halothiobacillus sp.]